MHTGSRPVSDVEKEKAIDKFMSSGLERAAPSKWFSNLFSTSGLLRVIYSEE